MPDDAPKVPESFTVSDGTPCSRCGYALKGLPLNGCCPECQASVTTSVAVMGIPRTPRWHRAAVTLYALLFLGWFVASFITVVPRIAAAFHRNWLIFGAALVVVGFVLAFSAFDRRRQVVPLIIIVLTLFIIAINA